MMILSWRDIASVHDVRFRGRFISQVESGFVLVLFTGRKVGGLWLLIQITDDGVVLGKCGIVGCSVTRGWLVVIALGGKVAFFWFIMQGTYFRMFWMGVSFFIFLRFLGWKIFFFKR